MLILSWNVAGLSTTVNRIHENYGTLDAFFRRHQADIVCLQEHKIPKAQLTSRSEPRQAASIANYESFWSCCTDQQKKGLNGVCTYAVKGSVIAADACALGSPDLDQQGRCILTDHGSFVLFNVYVPTTGGQSLSYKMKFLNALRRSMQKQREQGKHVILVGDLNISHGKNDVHWSNRTVRVDDVVREVSDSTDRSSLPAWKVEVWKHWGKIDCVLQTKQVVATQTTNTMTNSRYDKFRLAVECDNRRIFLGNHEVSQEHCQYYYDFSATTYTDAETGQELPAQEANVVRVSILAELLSKIAGATQFDEEKWQRQIANSPDADVERISPPRQWLTTVLEQDGMVDAFRHFYPDAQARFTCWNQNKNRRYVNEGARIDYTLIDAALLPHLLQCSSTNGGLRCGTISSKDDTNNHLSEEAALKAATANGRFQPVSFVGGGMMEAPRDALDTQFGEPHTGHVYTPPTFSDHIGVSMLLDNELLSVQQTLDTDVATRKAQPHKQQTSIASFFNKATSTTATKTKRTTIFSNSAKRQKPAPKNSVLHHFRKQA